MGTIKFTSIDKSNPPNQGAGVEVQWTDVAEHVCDYCGGDGCAGDCDAYYDAIADDIDARYETGRDREVE